MSSLVFGCPNCQQPFQVAASQAGKVVQCPACAQSVEIPANAFGDAAPPPTPPASEKPIVFACPTCQGQFGITQSMNGQRVACPHCQAPTLIQIQDLDPPQEDETEVAPAIKTDVSISKKQKRDIKKRAKSKQKSKGVKDKELFAPERKINPLETSANSVSDPGPADSISPHQDQSNPEAKSALPEKQTSAPATPPTPTPRVKPKRRLPTQPPPVADTPQTNTTEVTEEPEKTVTASAPSEAVTETETSEAAELTEHDSAVEPDSAAEDARKSIAHLLPPKFTVLDPSRLHISAGGDKFKVILPDGKGGMAQMDNRILRVKHGDEQVSLVSLTPKQKAQRRLISNIIAILIGIAIMWLAFTLLT